MCHMACFTCQVSHVRCHLSGVRRHMSNIIYFFKFSYLIFFCGQSVGVLWWRVCYKRCLPRLVFVLVKASLCLTWFCHGQHSRISHDHQAPFFLFMLLFLNFKQWHKAKTSCHMHNTPRTPNIFLHILTPIKYPGEELIKGAPNPPDPPSEKLKTFRRADFCVQIFWNIKDEGRQKFWNALDPKQLGLESWKVHIMLILWDQHDVNFSAFYA